MKTPRRWTRTSKRVDPAPAAGALAALGRIATARPLSLTRAPSLPEESGPLMIEDRRRELQDRDPDHLEETWAATLGAVGVKRQRS